MKKLKVCFFGSYDRDFTSNKIVLNGLLANGVDVVEVNSNVKMTRMDAKKDVTGSGFLKRIVKKWEIVPLIFKNLKEIRTSDVIYIGFPGHFDVLIAYPLSIIFRKPIVFNPLVVFYTGFVNDQGIIKEGSLLAKIFKFGERLIYKISDLVLADTPLQKVHLHDEFNVSNNKIEILPIGADDVVYPLSPKKTDLKTFNVMYYGLYAPLHGVEYIIEAANILKNEKKIKFVMVGNGNTYEENYKKAQELGLKNVEFLKDMNEQNALKTLSTADVFLGFLQDHPTVTRVIPNKVYQGLALGKAVITADMPVIRSVFDDKKNIYLCEAASGKSLAVAILDLYNNPKMKEKIAKNGYELFLDEFTPEKVGKKLVDILINYFKF